MNSVRVVDGVTIANVGWKNRPWMVIETGETFEGAAEDNFTPVMSYVRADDLYAAIYGTKHLQAFVTEVLSQAKNLCRHGRYEDENCSACQMFNRS